MDINNKKTNKSKSLSHKKLEYETKHDSIIGFLKLNYFIKQIKELQNNNHNGTLLLIDCVVSNSTNYSYKSEISSRYIKYIAEFLIQIEVDNKIFGRISDNCIGIYIHDIRNYNKNISDLKSFIKDIQKKINKLIDYEIEIIVGWVTYSEETNSVDLMLKHAEFALNEAREGMNNRIVGFNIKTYLESVAMLDKKNALNKILSQPILKYIYEPIFAIKEHRIIGYNAILRTQNNVLKNFEDLVDIARLNNSLYKLERIGLESIFKDISNFAAKLGNGKMFFTSITNEMIEQEKILEIDFGYEELYQSIVFEIIDSEHCDDYILKAKNKELHKRGIEIALGKYGTSYSNEALLLYMDPSYIKLSSLLVRGVDKDESRQQLVLNILSYAKSRNIKIIASDVISIGEFDVLVKMGVEYFYGNLFCGAKYNLDEIDDIYIVIDDIAYKYGLINRSYIDNFKDLLKCLPSMTQLTKREEQIVYLLCSNKTNIEIADSLDISSNTLKTHIRNIFNKFSVSSRKDLLNLCGNVNGELSTREKEILRLIVEGNTNEKIATILNISVNTVRVHIWNICTKQDVKSREELIDESKNMQVLL